MQPCCTWLHEGVRISRCVSIWINVMKIFHFFSSTNANKEFYREMLLRLRRVLNNPTKVTFQCHQRQNTHKSHYSTMLEGMGMSTPHPYKLLSHQRIEMSLRFALSECSNYYNWWSNSFTSYLYYCFNDNLTNFAKLASMKHTNILRYLILCLQKQLLIGQIQRAAPLHTPQETMRLLNEMSKYLTDGALNPLQW